ncbi:DUF397 domain-containing protein [Actinomadura sp. KC216]|uniref:DUF397 domain-containing protein n=1 Tax=Actinomadura sp. KC216 TaxID=2530370 RepID=UPI001043991A|nr:DUF397 domain-containing protein [Actinomadura sp. KC216]TDB83622.1 DUF397 domain-containing protein [Actinomadura sp. KC216]
MHPYRATAKWRTSSYSGGTGDCVEVADLAHLVAVRDSKDPAGPKLIFPTETWRSFTAQARAGACYT